MKKKTLMIVLALVLVCALAIGGTIAWLTSTTNDVKNTFTVGKVEIKLDEEDVEYDPDTTTYTDLGTRTEEGNDYVQIMPGDVLPKDPTVTVLKGSAESYVRVILEVSLTEDGIAAAQAAAQAGKADQIKAILAGMASDLSSVLTGYDKTVWVPYGFGTYEALTIDNDTAVALASQLYETGSVKFELWYAEKVAALDEDNKLPAIFTEIKVPGDLDEATLPIFDGMEITLTGHAIQTKNLATAAEAWQAFDGATAPAETEAP